VIRRALRLTLPGSPLTALAVHGIPWWATMILIGLGPTAYICRILAVYKLANKALDKAPPAQMAAVMTAVTGHGSNPKQTGRWLAR
jgi:hypothetical protein